MKAFHRRAKSFAMALILALATSALFSACNTKAKEEAALAVEVARLSVADAQAVRASGRVAVLVAEAEGSLRRAETALGGKEFAKAKTEADAASQRARQAVEEAAKKVTTKRPAKAVSRLKH